MYIRQREQAPIVQRIGDVFLGAAMEFRLAYPDYLGHYPIAEKRMKDEMEINSEFRLFLEVSIHQIFGLNLIGQQQCARQSAREGASVRFDLKHFLNRASEHLQKYLVLLETILRETKRDNPDVEFLEEAIEAYKSLQSVAQLRTFQTAMGKGTPGKWEWHDLVSSEVRRTFSKQEAKRQA